jgi:RHS repeat-associated protein
LNQYYQISGGGAGASNYYDANGNLKNDITHTYTWDADGNMLSTDGTTVTMMYDALDRMIEQTRGSSHTEIVYGPYGMKLALMNGASLVNAFVKLPGGSRAVYSSSGLAYYRHADHLGSSRLATTTTRTKYYDVAYAPYGEDYNGSGTTADLAFTDENQDTVKNGWSSNLYDFMFREYRTAHGRWTSPDPAGLGAVDPTNPQSWNRYGYVLNNPLALVDPLGLVPPCTTDPNDGILCITTGAKMCPDGSVYFGGECVKLFTGQLPQGCQPNMLYHGGVDGLSCGTGGPSNNPEPDPSTTCITGGPANCNPSSHPPSGPVNTCRPGMNCGSGQAGGNTTNTPPIPKPPIPKPPNPIICDSIQTDYTRSMNEINAGAWMTGWGTILTCALSRSAPACVAAGMSGAPGFLTENQQLDAVTQSFTAKWNNGRCTGALKSPFN